MIELEEEKKINRELWLIMRKFEEMRKMKFKVVFFFFFYKVNR